MGIQKHATKSRKGFTVIELMIVVAILGVLASVAIPSFRNYQWKAKRSEAFTNLGALAKTQKTYFANYDAYVGVGPTAEPGTTLGDTPGTTARVSTAVDTAFADVGWAPEGNVYYDYDSNTGPSGTYGCSCLKCFTATAYGDVDGDNSGGAVMFVHPDGNGIWCKSGQFGYTTPVDGNSNPIYDEPARNQGIDDF